jgi:hypothetical protein
VISIGRDPHPEVPGGVRPRLSAQQRAQLDLAINRMYQKSSKYGTPIVVDGLIESVDPLNRSQDEIGWEKSEQTVRNRLARAETLVGGSRRARRTEVEVALRLRRLLAAAHSAET